MKKRKLLSNQSKLFLDYWAQMESNDFYCISNNLVKRHELVYNSSSNLLTNGFYYIIDNDSISIEPLFEKEKLYALRLHYPTQINYELSAMDNNDLIFPKTIINAKTASELKDHLITKYGLAHKNITKDEVAFGTLSGHSERYKWVTKDKTVELNYSLSPVYKTFLVTQYDGLVTRKYNVYKYEIDGMTLTYLDTKMDSLYYKNNTLLDLLNPKKGRSSKLNNL